MRVQNFGVGSIRLQAIVGCSVEVTNRRCGCGRPMRAGASASVLTSTLMLELAARCWMTASI
jgi:hypothetical protein